MRWSSLILSSVIAFEAYGFDSAAWLMKREVFAREAERMSAFSSTIKPDVSGPAENLVIPFEHYPNGTVKMSLVAGRAQLMPDSPAIWGGAVKAIEYTEDGKELSRIDAEELLVDRDSRCGWAAGKVRAAFRGQATLEGRGIFLDFDERYLQITRDAKITAAGNELTSENADYDHLEGVAMFNGKVRLEHREQSGDVYELFCDRAFAFFEGTNDLRRVVALGSVKMENAKRQGGCAKAVFWNHGRKLIMYGEKGNDAWIREDGSHTGKLSGSKISFWFDSQQVEVEKSSLTIDADALKTVRGR